MEQDKSLDFKMKIRKLIEEDQDRDPSSITLPKRVIAPKPQGAKLDKVEKAPSEDVEFSDIDGNPIKNEKEDKLVKGMSDRDIKEKENNDLADRLIEIESERIRIENALEMRGRIKGIK